MHRKTSFYLILGGIWGMLSVFPYSLMVGGYVDLGILFKILTFPGWTLVVIGEAGFNDVLLSWEKALGLNFLGMAFLVAYPTGLGMIIGYIIKRIFIR